MKVSSWRWVPSGHQGVSRLSDRLKTCFLPADYGAIFVLVPCLLAAEDVGAMRFCEARGARLPGVFFIVVHWSDVRRYVPR